MNKTIKLNSDAWSELTNVEVIDPDGWDRTGDFKASWTEKITFAEFVRRCGVSTTHGFGGDSVKMKVAAVTNVVMLKG